MISTTIINKTVTIKEFHLFSMCVKISLVAFRLQHNEMTFVVMLCICRFIHIGKFLHVCFGMNIQDILWFFIWLTELTMLSWSLPLSWFESQWGQLPKGTLWFQVPGVLRLDDFLKDHIILGDCQIEAHCCYTEWLTYNPLEKHSQTNWCR